MRMRHMGSLIGIVGKQAFTCFVRAALDGVLLYILKI